MPRKTSASLILVIFSLSGIAFFTTLIIPKFEQTALSTLLQPGNTPTNLIFLPVIQDNLTAMGTPTPANVDASVLSSELDHDPNPQDIDTEGTVEVINTPIPYPIMPTPDINAPVSHELAKIEITQFKPLELPSKTHSFFSKTSWSPDSRKFVGHFAAWMDGIDEDRLYMGDLDTGNFTLLQNNGTWPTWSKDGHHVYYLAPRRDGTSIKINEFISRPYFDLYRQALNDNKGELLLSNVLPPQVAVAQVIEAMNVELILLDNAGQIVLMPPATKLAEISKEGEIVASKRLFDTTPASAIENALPTSFSVSPTGKFIINIKFGANSQLLDLETMELIGAIPGLETPINLAWSSDETRLAYTNQSGLFTYDIKTGESQQLVMNEAFGFSENDPRGGLAWPVWLSGDQQILFVGLSRDWLDRNRAASDINLDYFTFVVATNSKEVKALGQFAVESVAPDRHSAIIRQLDPNTGYFNSLLATINY